MAVLKILSDNSRTEIGRKWNFETISTIEEFRKRMPLTTYSLYQPYIERMTGKGEHDLITVEKTNYFAPYSGTSGKMKFFPVSDATFRNHMPPPDHDTRSLLLFDVPKNADCHTTQSGLPIKTLSVGEVKHLVAKYPENHSSPLATLDLSPAALAFYVQFVFGLKDGTVNEIGSSFITTLHSALLELTSKWEQMVRDIEMGWLHQSLPSDERRTLEDLLGGPDPVRACELRAIFEKAKSNSFKEVLTLVWPRLKVIKCLCSGSLASLCIPKIKHYISSSVHILSSMYVCSEALIGLPAKPLEETSLFRLTQHNFYEFIPISNSHLDQPMTFLASEIEVGKVYEIVLTTPTGVYRYRIGDCIKVIEQGENGPLIDFHGRRETTLHLREHILYEANFEEAVATFTETVNSKVDYIVSVDTTTLSRYKIWLECFQENSTIADLGIFLDAALQEADDSYKYEREHCKLEQLQVCHVKHGTFALLQQQYGELPRMITEDTIFYGVISSNY